MITHTGERLHICSQCNKSFSRTENLKTHMLSHSGEVCTMQEIIWRRWNMLTHTGERLQICAECNKSFRLANNLKRHLLTHRHDKCNFFRAVFGLISLVLTKLQQFVTSVFSIYSSIYYFSFQPFCDEQVVSEYTFT